MQPPLDPYLPDAVFVAASATAGAAAAGAAVAAAAVAAASAAVFEACDAALASCLLSTKLEAVSLSD